MWKIIKSIKKVTNRHINTTKTQTNTKTKHKSTPKKSTLDKMRYFKDYMFNWLQEDNNIFNKEYACYNNNCCPNCGCILDNKITSSKKCIHCKEKIILRTNKLTSKKLLLSEKRLKEYNKHDNKRSEIVYFEKIMSRQAHIYNDYMNKFYELKSKSTDPRNVVYPFANYVGFQLDNIAYKEYMRIINLSEGDMALESFEVIRQFKFANRQYLLLAEIADYKGHKEIALDAYATAAYRGVQISMLDSIVNPYYKMKIIDIMGNIFPEVILKFLKKSGYSIDDFKKIFLEKRHPFILEQISNEESWNYVYDSIKLYQNMKLKNNVDKY